MNNPLISIVVPVYNVEKYLPLCIESIIRQTYKNLEIFLVDDGSPDNCGKICDEYAQKDNRIKVIHKQNGGLSDARNVAIDVATGEYITFIDSDDYVKEDYIEYLYGILSKYDADMSITFFNMFYEGCSPKEEPTNTSKECKILNIDDALTMMFYQKEFDTSAWGKLYKIDLFKDGIRYPKGLLYEDLPTTYRIIIKCNTIVFSQYKSYYYLLRKDSIEGSSFNPRKLDSCLTIIKQLERDMPLMSKTVQRALKCRIVSFSLHVLLEIPEEQKEDIEQLFYYVKKYRTLDLFDRNARFKNRVASLLSYFGCKPLFLLKSFGNYRKK